MFSNDLGTHLRTRDMQDITPDYPELGLDYIGIREASATINIIGIVKADDMEEVEILGKIREFYDYILGFKKDLLFSKIYKPNGVICFVFEEHCKYRYKKLLPAKSLIDHSHSEGRVVVPWVIDVPNREITPHNRMVSWMPPVRINLEPPLGVYPGMKVLDNFLRTYSGGGVAEKVLKDMSYYTDLETLTAQTFDLISEGKVRTALIRVKNSIPINSGKHHDFVMLLSSYSRITEGQTDLIQTDPIYNRVTDATIKYVKELKQEDLHTKK